MKYGITSFLLFWLLIGQLACAGSPLYYSAEAIEAQVVDAETGKPIEGVVVTANWQLFHSTVGGRVPGSQLMVMEAVTNKDGKFSFTAWGSKLALWGYLDNHDPQLLLFKSGYDYKRLTNRVSSKTNHDSVRRSEWNGKTIEMKSFRGTQEEYVRHLSFLMGGLRFIEDDCQWKKTPRMLIALQEQADKFKALGIVSDIYRIGYLPTDEKKCGSVKEYFRRYQQ